MRGAVIHGPGDVRVEERENPTIVAPTDANHRGINEVTQPTPMGREYAGVVTEIGDEVKPMDERSAIKTLPKP